MKMTKILQDWVCGSVAEHMPCFRPQVQSLALPPLTSLQEYKHIYELGCGLNVKAHALHAGN